MSTMDHHQSMPDDDDVTIQPFHCDGSGNDGEGVGGGASGNPIANGDEIAADGSDENVIMQDSVVG